MTKVLIGKEIIQFFDDDDPTAPKDAKQMSDAELLDLMLDGVPEGEDVDEVRADLAESLKPAVELAEPDVVDIDEVKDRLSTKELAVLAREHEIKGRSKMNEGELIRALLDQGVSL